MSDGVVVGMGVWCDEGDVMGDHDHVYTTDRRQAS